MFSLLGELDVTAGTRADWPYFARWHYRAARIGPVRFVTLLWHRERPVGICVFTAPALSLAGRNRYFGLSGRWSRLTLRAINRRLVGLSRIVLHPSYRGAGIAAAFVRRSCELCPFDWIETLAEMARFHGLFERAGFTRVDVPARRKRTHARHSNLYKVPHARGHTRSGQRHAHPKRLSTETHHKSAFATPAYYIYDNRPPS